MRLGQLARKYGISKKDVIAYLKEIEPEQHSLGTNTKLSEQQIMLLSRRFENPDGLFETGAQSQKHDQVQEQDLSQEQDQDPEQSQTQEHDQIQEQPQTQSGQSIETDKLLELLESEEASVDLSKITLIKAPKRELDGLKVVGKIELPEVKPRAGRKADQPDKDPKNRKNDRGQPRQLSEEEREKRRLAAKKRKEAAHARQEEQKREKEKKRQKALNKARYQQKLKRAKAHPLKQKELRSKQVTPPEVENIPEPPKTLLGKVWRWLNTY